MQFFVPTQIWPEKFPSFQQTVKELYLTSFELAFTILECMAMALKLNVRSIRIFYVIQYVFHAYNSIQDPCFFTKNIKHMTDLDKTRVHCGCFIIQPSQMIIILNLVR